MLNSLYIKNYRNLKDFRIDSVGQINLITGKNNTGKSTILEAIAIYASEGKVDVIIDILKSRDEYSDSSFLEIFQSLFSNWHFNEEDDNQILIGTDISDSVKMYYSKISADQIFHRRCFCILFGNSSRDILPESIDTFYRIDKLTPSRAKCHLVNSINFKNDTNGKMFDKIATTEKENNVIDALKIIEPQAQRIAFVDSDTANIRKAVVKLLKNDDAIPLQSMGDGINRILTIILAAVNCENGFLLIDEFENGLHHTVQEQLWKIIFKLAKDLNIQVFATTHSDDCVKGFSNVLNSSDNTVTGQYIRLENKKGSIKVVDYSSEELEIATEHNIETR
jgi:AAA15 family ATPase/GTPase